MKKYILSVAYDGTLAKARNHLLTTAGYTVVDATSVAGASDAMRGKVLAALLLGHRVPEAERNEIARVFKQENPRGKIVMLYDASISQAELADALISIHDPQRVVETLDGFLQEGAGTYA